MTGRTLSTVKALSREDILRGGRAIKVVEVEVPEWEGRVFVRGMTGRQRDRVEQLFAQARDSKRPVENIRATVCAMCLCDEQGTRLFEDKDAGALGEIDGVLLDRLFDKASELSGIKPTAIEDAEKNCEPGRSASGGSDSPGTSD